MGFLDKSGITTLVTKLKNYFALKTEVNAKQDALISGVNLKTVGNNSLLGPGNIVIPTELPCNGKIRYFYTDLTASDKGYACRLWFTSADGSQLVPINTTASNSATVTKTFNTRPINPFGTIIYYNLYPSINAGSSFAPQYSFICDILDVRYSYVVTLVATKPVYLKCMPQSNGSAIMSDIVQNLPNTADGYIYIHLGYAHNTTSMVLDITHPVYYHDGTRVRLWTGESIS